MKSIDQTMMRSRVPSRLFAFEEANSTRALILLAFGAAIGLGIAGFSLFTAQGTVTHYVPPEDVALVNQRPILRTDLIAQAESQFTEPYEQITKSERLQVLNDMIHEELFVQRGLELDFPGTDPDTRAALVAAVEQQVVADVTTHNATDAELMTYYQRNKSLYSSEGLMTLHNLVLPLADESIENAISRAKQALESLRAGKSLGEIKSTYGLTEIGAGDEQFYFAEKIHIGDQLFEDAKPLVDGAVSEPIPASDGVHILQMVKNEKPKLLDFAQARSRVETDYRFAESKRLKDADEKYLRSKAEVLLADDYKDYETYKK